MMISAMTGSIYVAVVVLIVLPLAFSWSISPASPRAAKSALMMSSMDAAPNADAWNRQIDDANALQTARDMTGFKLAVTFDGFGDLKGMPAAISFEDNFKAVWSGGIETHRKEPGFWRVIKFEDGREQLEVTCPVLPEWMYFFDIWEASILWRGDLDPENGLVKNGEVITNKKRFGIFTYQETLATFTGEVYFPDETLPKMELPKLSEQRFLPPNDFYSPLDMERFPEIFSNSYRQWWFDVEDALAIKEMPPARPKPFWVPKSSSEERAEPDMSRVKEGKMSRRKELRKGGKGKGF